MTEDREQRLASLRNRLAANSDGILESIANEYQCTLYDAVTCLPSECWQRFDGDAFVPIMTDLANWGEMTVIVHTPDVIVEVSSAIPEGKMGRGFFNLEGSGPLSGHLRASHCRDIVFLTRPFMKRQTASIVFFNHEGHSMLKIFVGRDADGKLRQNQLQRMRELAERLHQGVV